MEKIKKDLIRNYFVHCADDVIRSISRATYTLVKRYVEVLNGKSQAFKISEINYAGSIAEETRVWRFEGSRDELRVPVLEFDFLAVFSAKKHKEITVTDSCSGYVRISTSSGDPVNKVDCIDPNDMSDSFESELKKTVIDACSCYSSHRKEHKRLLERCQKCLVKDKIGHLTIPDDHEIVQTLDKKCNLVFVWTSKAIVISAKDCLYPGSEPRKLDRIYVLVDILPCYRLDNDTHDISYFGELNVVPKACYACEESVCWRLSYRQTETEKMRKANESHRNVYMTLKVLVNIAFPDSTIISSYVLKTAFLRHIGTCSDRMNMTACLSNILGILSSSFREKCLINPLSECNILEKYHSQRDGFFQEWDSIFKLINQVVNLTDLLGDDATIGAMHIYLQKVTSIYQNLMERQFESGNVYLFNDSLKRNHEAVAAETRDLRLSQENTRQSISVNEFKSIGVIRNYSNESLQSEGSFQTIVANDITSLASTIIPRNNDDDKINRLKKSSKQTYNAIHFDANKELGARAGSTQQWSRQSEDTINLVEFETRNKADKKEKRDQKCLENTNRRDNQDASEGIGRENISGASVTYKIDEEKEGRISKFCAIL